MKQQRIGTAIIGCTGFCLAVLCCSGPTKAKDVAALDQQVTALTAAGRWREAEPIQRQIVAINEQTAQGNPDVIAGSIMNLATICKNMGKYDEGIALVKKAMAIDERTYGPQHENIAGDLMTLANIYLLQSSFRRPNPCTSGRWRSIKRGWARTMPRPGHEQPGDAQERPGQVRRGRATLWPGAQGLGEELRARARDDGPHHRRPGERLRVPEPPRPCRAAPQARSAIRERVLQPEHPDIAMNLQNLTLVATSRARYAEAEQFQNRAMALYQKALGAEHPAIVLCLSTLATIYYQQGRYAEAEPIYKQALALGQKVLEAGPSVRLERADQPGLDLSGTGPQRRGGAAPRAAPSRSPRSDTGPTMPIPRTCSIISPMPTPTWAVTPRPSSF